MQGKGAIHCPEIFFFYQMRVDGSFWSDGFSAGHISALYVEMYIFYTHLCIADILSTLNSTLEVERCSSLSVTAVKALSRINHVSKGASFTVSVFRCLGFRDKVRDTECCDAQGVRERVKRGAV